MNKSTLEKELQVYNEKIQSVRSDFFRLEGIIIYLQNKIKEIENSDLTNS